MSKHLALICWLLALIGCQHGANTSADHVTREALPQIGQNPTKPLSMQELQVQCDSHPSSELCVELSKRELELGTILGAKVRLEQLCLQGIWSACHELGTQSHFEMAPYNRRRFLKMGCEGGHTLSCVAGAEREQRNGSSVQAKQYLQLACAQGAKQYCDAPEEKLASPSFQPEVALAPVEGGGDLSYRFSAGPCASGGCPLIVSLNVGSERVDHKELLWRTERGPIERIGGKSMSIGEGDDFIGVSIQRVRMGPKLFGITVRAERGMQRVQYRTDTFVALGRTLHQISAKSLKAYGVILGRFDREDEAVKAMDILGQKCLQKLQVLSAGLFASEPKPVLGIFSTDESALRLLWEELRRCDPTLSAEVTPLF